eukprot:scaffold77639_cov32-Tisochrysis_lutea.AAC.1
MSPKFHRVAQLMIPIWLDRRRLILPTSTYRMIPSSKHLPAVACPQASIRTQVAYRAAWQEERR